MARDNSDSVQLESHPDDPQLTEHQPTTTPHGCIALPAETIYHILRFLGPQDLIRLQAVCKLFQAIIYDPAVWRTLYCTARLPLPPGPFPWQTTRFLQRALVHSARLARAWTTEPLTLISKKVFTGPRSIEDDRFKWVCGRWLIVSKDMKQLRSRDVETGSEQVLWDHGSFAFWAAASVMNPLEHFIYVAVHLDKGRLSNPVKLLEFVVDDDTGYLSGPEIIDVPTWTLPREAFIPRIRVDSGMAPYAYISLCSANKPRQSLIFDPQNRLFYKFPRFRTQLDLLLNYRGAWLPHLVEVYFTQTHLFVLNRSYLIHGNIGNVEVIQIFALPDVDSDPGPNPAPNHDSVSGCLADSDGIQPIVRELRLTHEILTRDTGSLWLTPIRNEIVDPITQSTTLRFMHTYSPFHPTPETRSRLVCTDYVLPASRPGPSHTTAADNDNHGNSSATNSNNSNNNLNNNNNLNAIVRSIEPVLPITVVSHDILSVQGVWNGNLVDVSDDGFVKGLCMVGCYADGSNIPNTAMVHKFAVDATGDQCVTDVGDPFPPWADLNTNRCYQYSFDGMRGKMWQTKGDVLELDKAGLPVDREVLAIVLDFK
ncbi:hypothetical protein OG21DRAFT_1509348 [Imleria badia]|nr:hypothetical protein OG21DRAFT_1509348 [Imleria badia]